MTFIKPPTRQVKPLNEVVKFDPATEKDIDRLLNAFSVKPQPGHGVSVETLVPPVRRKNRKVHGKKYHEKQAKTAKPSGKDKGNKGKNGKGAKLSIVA